jgi:hypothetical protein
VAAISWLEAFSYQLAASGTAATKERQLPAATAGSFRLEEILYESGHSLAKRTLNCLLAAFSWHRAPRRASE